MLIFCPEELEVPKFRSRHPGLHHVEPSLRPMDGEEKFPFDRIASEKPLVLAAFGSHTVRYPGFHEQCKLIAELAVRQPELQFVLAAGTAHKVFADNFSIKPPNLVVIEKLPQRRLLELCQIFITHGGLSSIKEAIVAGKPMIVLPALYDQPFNAMRVRYHNLGESIFPDKVQIDVLEAAVLRTMDGRYNTAVAAMRQIFLAQESAKPSFAIIEAHLGCQMNSTA
jgi:zeaxanthin glucosyltransferase